MSYDSVKHRRRSIRLKGYDYSQSGAYFVTICAQGRECLFGEIEGNGMRLNDAGRMVLSEWEGLPKHYPQVELDAFVIMPNHVHAIVVLADAGVEGAGAGHVGMDDHNVGAGFKPAPTNRPAPTGLRHGLSEIVRALKTFSARRINRMRDMLGAPVWQRGYYEHVVRGDDELNRIREYIAMNPAQWAGDVENPASAPDISIRYPWVGAGFKPAPTNRPAPGEAPWQV